MNAAPLGAPLRPIYYLTGVTQLLGVDRKRVWCSRGHGVLRRTLALCKSLPEVLGALVSSPEASWMGGRLLIVLIKSPIGAAFHLEGCLVNDQSGETP